MTARPFFSNKKSPDQHFFLPEKCQLATRGHNFLHDRGCSKDEKVGNQMQ
jgi:hypothetical protein